MTIDQLIDMLQRRVMHRSALQSAAYELGGFDRVTTLDAEIGVTTATLAQLQML